MRARAIRDDVQNALDFLQEAELALYTNPVLLRPTHVSWHALPSAGPLLGDYGFTTVGQYLTWVREGAYSAVLRDASLLQLSFDVDEDLVVGHRLAYVPCPVVVDETLLAEGEPVEEVVLLHLDDGNGEELTLRSPVRFDYDQSAAHVDHPAAHFSINSPECRVACVAPVHPYRFIDFVFRHFYPVFRGVHDRWFDSAGRRNLGGRVITEEDRSGVHLMWPIE
ncbi:MAG TPA: DUF2290 domain-containing protein [Actinomycetota bacterium]|nr:DUF2290 domain-containing protein [Actinomycetota bacterium]